MDEHNVLLVSQKRVLFQKAAMLAGQFGGTILVSYTSSTDRTEVFCTDDNLYEKFLAKVVFANYCSNNPGTEDVSKVERICSPLSEELDCDTMTCDMVDSGQEVTPLSEEQDCDTMTCDMVNSGQEVVPMGYYVPNVQQAIKAESPADGSDIYATQVVMHAQDHSETQPDKNTVVLGDLVVKSIPDVENADDVDVKPIMTEEESTNAFERKLSIPAVCREVRPVTRSRKKRVKKPVITKNVIKETTLLDRSCRKVKKSHAITKSIKKKATDNKKMKPTRVRKRITKKQNTLDVDGKEELEGLNLELIESTESTVTVPIGVKKRRSKTMQHKTSKSITQVKQQYRCEKCNQLFPSAFFLKRHMAGHAHLGPFYCEKCPRKFSYYRNLLKHNKEHAATKDKMPYVCSFCGRRFAYLKYLRYHEKRHTGLGLRTCADCGATFTNNQALRIHRLYSHQKYRPYMCKICGKRLSRMHHLRNHEQSHMGVKPHGCPYCPARFNQKTALSEHILTHTNPERLTCEICLKTFTRVRNLRVHIATLHKPVEERPLACEICNKRYACNRSLKDHYKMHLKNGEYKNVQGEEAAPDATCHLN